MFIKRQGADADAAYKRLSIIRRHLKEMEAEINATNTVDVVGEHEKHYQDAAISLQLAILAEENLIHQAG